MNPFKAIALTLRNKRLGLHKPIGRDHVDGLTINTVYTVDFGYETAVLDAVNAYPVERYPDNEKALRGHKKWVKKAATITEVERLWYGGIPSETVQLKRGYNEP